MKVLNKLIWVAVGVIITILCVWLYNQRATLKNLVGSNNNKVVNRINPEFASYIHAFTTGYISSASSIKIKFSNEFANGVALNTPVDEKYFSFEPSISGETVWKDAQTLEFIPKERLKQGQTYKAVFHLDKLMEVKKELEDFEFQFQVIKQSVQMQVNDLQCYHAGDFNYYSLSGNIAAADFVEQVEIEKTLNVKLAEKNLSVKWIHNNNEHKFIIDSIERAETSSEKIILICDAKNIGVEYKESKTLEIPARGLFSILNVKVVNDNEQYVLLTFSNPLDQQQSLEGIIDVSEQNEEKYIISDNQVSVYVPNIKPGAHTLKTYLTIKDSRGQRLSTLSSTTPEYSLVFEELKPAVKFLGRGNILPSGNGLSIPFEAVNLRAIDVKVIKIHENNVLQFLQSNNIDGDNSLAQVGKKVAEKRINLGITNPADFAVRKKFSLDLEELIKSEPGAIYRVMLSFRKSYSAYSCLGNNANEKFEMEDIQKTNDEEELSYYGYDYNDYYFNDYSEDGEYYNWNDRDNPCKATYYMRWERTVARNILASDIGLTLKKGNDGSMFVVTNDLKTSNPLSGVNIELYDYQKQLIETAATNSDGQVFISPTRKPIFVVAKKDKQRAYLKLDEGNTLPLSMYDVSGDVVKKGVKGFIYGERGVWRPGDTLFLNFILEDKLGTIPASHPVSFELYNPQGQLYKRLLSSKSVDGFYNFTTLTDVNAPTGIWNAEVKVGSIKFNKNIRIETIMPNRLKINVNVGDNKLLLASQNNRVSLHTAWLTGATAHNLAANISMALAPQKTTFTKFKDYNFDDNTLRFEPQNITVFDGKVNNNGDAEFPLQINAQKNAPGFLRASFNTKVFEEGGAFSIDRFSMTYSPYKHYVGVKIPDGEKNTGILYTEKDHKIKIVTVDEQGKVVSRSNLRFVMYKLHWRWWWEQYGDETADYASDTYHQPVQTQNFSTEDGEAEIKVNIKDSDWGRYLIRVIDNNGGHSTSAIAYFDWANWLERDGGDEGNSNIMASMLNFTTDKTSYKTNDEVSVTIPSPQNGRALVTVENGSRVIEAHWLETQKGKTLFKFKVTPEMSPNIYVHVSLMQPHVHDNDLPIRLYGVVSVNVDNPETHLKPVIKMSAELQPEQNVNIIVSEENGKEMAFTLAVVDEGLLDITRFKTPDPYQTFYAKEALGVKTWDIYDNVIGAFGAELERVLSIGGDGSVLGKDGAKANRFVPVVKFFGPFHLSKRDKKTIAFKMPRYVGSVRTMVIAGNKGAYGFAENATPVKAPLMILGTLPRVLSVGEQVKLPVTVFGGSQALGKTDVKLEVNGLLQIVGSNVKSVNLNKDDEKVLSFDVKVKNVTGIAKAKIIATSGTHTATYEMELDVRNPNPYQTIVKDFWVDAGKSLKENFVPVGVAGTNSGVLELSTIPPINLEERLQYLISYPHGCVEQTTSQSFAQLYLSDITELSAQRKSATENNVRQGIQALQKFQLASGALSYWQGVNDVSDWGTSYAGHFMLAAEKKGYSLPANFIKQWVKYQQSAAQNFEINKNQNYNTDELQAYRLYVLALSGNPATGAMNRLREYSALSNQARYFLAMAYSQIGQNNEAEQLISKASEQSATYKINYYTYGSSERDMAVILQTLCLMNKKQQAFSQLKKVSGFLSSNAWLSTQTTAFGLVAVSDFIKKFGGSSAMQAVCSINGKEMSLKGNSAITQLPVDFKTSAGGNFSVQNNGKGVLYARFVNRGKPPVGEEKEANENIGINVVYKDMNGNAINPNELTQSSNFMLSVTVNNLGLVGEIKNLALINYIPSGWEIHNARMDENEAALKNSSYTYQDIRDDKVMTYFDLGTRETKTFSVLLNAAYEGTYYLPAVNVEAMYDNSIYARTKGKWIKVVKEGNVSVAEK